MQDPHLVIERLISIGLENRRSGDYEVSHLRLREAVALLDGGRVCTKTHCRVLLEAARGAYYLTYFDEGRRYLDHHDRLLEGHTPDGTNMPVVESKLVRANILRRLGEFSEALAVLASCPDDRELGDLQHLVAEKHLIEGACRFYLNDIGRAEERLEIALGLATHCNDPRLRARVLTMLGFLARSRGQCRQAEEYFTRAKDICRSASDYYGEAAAALNMGIVQYRSGRFADARESVLRAKSVFGKIGWHLGVCRCLLALGNIAKYERDFSTALRLYGKARRLAERLKFKREVALALEFVGEINYERGDYREAGRNYTKSLKIVSAIAPDGDVVVELKRRMGELHAAIGEPGIALKHLREGLTLAVRLKERFEEGLIERAMGMLLFSTGERDDGKVHFRRAVELLSGAGGDYELARTHLHFAEALLGELEPPAGKQSCMEHEHGSGEEDVWNSLIEAGQLFGEIGVSYWRKRVDNLLASVAARKQVSSCMGSYVHESTKIVEIEYSPDFLIHRGLVAVSRSMKELWQQMSFAARYARPVLITGETGTGKELVARAIHEIGGRAGRPFVAVNCAAVPDHLFESEFFGHRKGCFTGALTDRRGFFEAANGGTLFLDEVGELSTLQQVKLLRVLQEGRVRRVGENIEYPIDVRIISATNRNLEERLEGTGLRKDFYYRINAEHIHIPPLRERSEDIVPLVSYLLRNEGKHSAVRIESAALKCLLGYSWPGNVRELITVIDRVRCIGNGNVVTVDMFPRRIRNRGESKGPGTPPYDGNAGPEVKKSTLKKALALCRGNKSAAAKWLGISRGTLYKELRNNGLAHYIRQCQIP